jgi:hypothetical protein
VIREDPFLVSSSVEMAAAAAVRSGVPAFDLNVKCRSKALQNAVDVATLPFLRSRSLGCSAAIGAESGTWFGKSLKLAGLERPSEKRQKGETHRTHLCNVESLLGRLGAWQTITMTINASFGRIKCTLAKSAAFSWRPCRSDGKTLRTHSLFDWTNSVENCKWGQGSELSLVMISSLAAGLIVENANQYCLPCIESQNR